MGEFALSFCLATCSSVNALIRKTGGCLFKGAMLLANLLPQFMPIRAFFPYKLFQTIMYPHSPASHHSGNLVSHPRAIPHPYQVPTPVNPPPPPPPNPPSQMLFELIMHRGGMHNEPKKHLRRRLPPYPIPSQNCLVKQRTVS